MFMPTITADAAPQMRTHHSVFNNHRIICTFFALFAASVM